MAIEKIFPEVSIIIPAKNEEKSLPKLLDSLSSQREVFIEMIVAIAPSTSDSTYLIAKKYDCKIVEGGRAATARNNGAEKAIFDTLFFLDADTYPISKYFMSDTLGEFNERNLDVAGTLLEPDLSDFKGKHFKNSLYKSFFDITNFIFLKKEKSKKPKMQSGMFLKKNAFFALGGFREEIFGEDSELAQRAVNPPFNFNFGILQNCGKLRTSVRRYEREGFLRMLSKVLYLNFKAEIFGYDSVKGVYDSLYIPK